MARDELDAFLRGGHPGRIGVVATTMPDGSPHAVPVWYRWDGAAVTVWAGAERRWVLNLVADPRVAFSVQEELPPYAAVLMRGHAEGATGVAPELEAEIVRICRCYLPEDRVEAYAAEWGDLRTIVTIRPDRIASWPSAG
jgi:PPOX class probable F420-dependent enzyme